MIAPSPLLWYVYDGECPLCRKAATYYRLKRAVGTLQLVDARVEKDHPVLTEINAAGLDLDQGMVIKYGDRLYYGKDAMHLMADLGAEDGLFNRVLRSLSSSPTRAAFFYPLIKAGRDLSLKLKGVRKIANLQPRN